MNKMKLLLFDVDLTLINTAGAGRNAMTKAFYDMFQFENGFEHVSFAGSTDGSIFRQAIDRTTDEWSLELEMDFRERYFQYLAKTLQVPDSERHIEPGVEETLDELKQRGDVTLALLTGNWQAGAKLKLESFGLWDYFEFGAFSDDAWIRSDLPAIAATKLAELKGIEVDNQDVYVIGDTPRDIECARPFGANSVAIATGMYSYSELQSADPHYLFNSFKDRPGFLDILD